MPFDQSVRETLTALQKTAPNTPLLALGQTVFWDEPLKAMLPIIAEEIGVPIRFTAGIHDTDYFAKLPGGIAAQSAYTALRKNDGTTKGFWSAAGEFSSLFGAETPVTRESLAHAGVFLERLAKKESSFLDHVTEAYGWRGIAGRASRAQITSELNLEPIFPVLQKTFHWAVATSVELIANPAMRDAADQVAERMHTILCDNRESCRGQTLATFYECLLSDFHKLVSGRKITAEITRTSLLLSFSTRTAHLPRFQFVNLFLNPKTKKIALESYNKAIEGSETYQLEKFGTGAIPFDLVLPGVGRGTIRVTESALIVMTPTPKFANLDAPIESVADLAAVVEKHFGNAVLVGKALTLISMLSSEFVFAFHETASAYVSQTRELHNLLMQHGIELNVNPILRIGLNAWDAFGAVETKIKLPEHLAQALHTDTLTAAEFSSRWRELLRSQCELLESLGAARSPQALISKIASLPHSGGENWLEEYEELSEKLHTLRELNLSLELKTKQAHERLRAIKAEWQTLERKMGQAYRANDQATRDTCIQQLANLKEERKQISNQLLEIRQLKADASNQPDIIATRNRRREIEYEAEEIRLSTARNAILTKKGLAATNRRPSGWWLPTLSPDGKWFDALMRSATFRLEPLVGDVS